VASDAINDPTGTHHETPKISCATLTKDLKQILPMFDNPQ
jgi:hypothetical protein